MTAIPNREAWGTRAGFILAAIGSAVGLGNMWRFSYIASEGGGAAFVIVYLLIVAAVGIPLMTAEFVVGRMTNTSPARAVRALGGRAWGPLGWLFVLCGFGILSYYSVIAGWTMRYAFDAVRNAIPADTGAYFAKVSSGNAAVVTHVLFMGLTILIILGGIKRGIERAALVLMPLMFVILGALAVWAATLEGAGAGYSYYLKPDLGHLLNGKILTQAAGQAFFSLSLGMGAMMTYASYLRTRGDLGRDATTVALSDFAVAFVAGLVVFPVVFTFGLQGTVGASAVGALFIALPAGFASMGSAGAVVDTAFFVMLFLAAITSAISLLEVVVTAALDVFGWTRKRTTLVFGGIILLFGLPSAYNTTFLGNLDTVVGDFLLILGGFLTAVLVGYKILPRAEAELADGVDSTLLRRSWAVLMRYVVPVILLVVLWHAAPRAWVALKGLVTFAS
jgi:NSS family neurotransmitter:Na+ symporter